MAMNGAFASAGPTGAAAESSNDIIPRILGALEVIYSPRSTNQSRFEAQAFLEDVKQLKEGPSHGFTLASDRAQSPIVRHYGLSLLEYAIKHKWAEYSQEEAAYLRNWVLELSQHVSKENPLYIRNKIAQLWVEVAKRSWAGEWMDMDAMLVQLWQIPGLGVHKELVLSILEMLSDEIFSGDDTVVAIREHVLSKAAVEIFTSAAVLVEAFPNRQPGPDVRFGPEGWLQRATALLSECLSSNIQGDDDVRSCATRSLALLYSLMAWAIPKSVIASRCVPTLCDGLMASHVSVQKVPHPSSHPLLMLTDIPRPPWRHFMHFILAAVSPTASLQTWSYPCMTSNLSSDISSCLNGPPWIPTTLTMTSTSLPRSSPRYG